MIWILITVSISCDDNPYAKRVSLLELRVSLFSFIPTGEKKIKMNEKKIQKLTYSFLFFMFFFFFKHFGHLILLRTDFEWRMDVLDWLSCTVRKTDVLYYSIHTCRKGEMGSCLYHEHLCEINSNSLDENFNSACRLPMTIMLPVYIWLRCVLIILRCN